MTGLADLSERRVNDLSLEWDSFASTLEGWEKLLLEKSDRLKEAAAEVSATRVLWEGTLDSVRSVRSFRSLTKSVTATVQEIAEAADRLERRFKEILALQGEIAKERRRISDDRNRIRTQAEALRGQLFSRDALPLWEVLSPEPSMAVDATTAVTGTWKRNVVSTITYLQQSMDRVVAHLALAVVVFFLFFLIRRQVQGYQIPADGTGQFSLSRNLLLRPVASSFLVIIFLAFFIFPNKPAAFTDLLRLILLFPLSLLAMDFGKQRVHRQIVLLAIVYAMNVTEEVIPGSALADRLIILAEALIGLGALIVLVRPGGLLRDTELTGLRKAMRALWPIGVACFAISLVANVVGSVSLARRMASGTLVAGANGMGIAVVAIMLNGIVFLTVTEVLSRLSAAIRASALTIVKQIVFLVTIGAVLLWTRSVLVAFGLYPSVSDWLSEVVANQWGFGVVRISIAEIFVFLAVILATFVITRVIRSLLEHDLFPRIRMPRGVPGAISMVVRYSLVSFGIILALASAGINLGEFGLLAGALGVGLGFGLQNTVANFVSGVILAFERPIQKGDTVQIGSLWGKVGDIGIRSTTVNSFDGAEVIIPNSDFISEPVTNWTLSNRVRRLSFPFKVTLGSDPRSVMMIVREIPEKHEKVLDQPSPFVIFEGFGEYFLEFTLYYYIHTESYFEAKSDIGIAVLDALREKGIDAPTPQHVVRVQDPTSDRDDVIRRKKG
ncbi:MAG: mechanosensitive ion channel [Ignavibacteria bacterium]|nr:mechanosensitive ion channel [Ignavibacteria bacterium]